MEATRENKATSLAEDAFALEDDAVREQRDHLREGQCDKNLEDRERQRMRENRLRALEERRYAGVTEETSPRKDNSTQQHKEREAEKKDILKKLEKIIVWQIHDVKHLETSQISEAVGGLLMILNNVKEHPLLEENKYRKLRLSNPKVQRYLRPKGAEECLILCGFHHCIENHEKVLRNNAAPGSVEWEVLLAAIARLQEVRDHLEKSSGNVQKKEIEERRQKVMHALKEDEEDRHVRFQYGANEQS